MAREAKLQPVPRSRARTVVARLRAGDLRIEHLQVSAALGNSVAALASQELDLPTGSLRAAIDSLAPADVLRLLLRVASLALLEIASARVAAATELVQTAERYSEEKLTIQEVVSAQERFLGPLSILAPPRELSRIEERQFLAQQCILELIAACRLIAKGKDTGAAKAAFRAINQLLSAQENSEASSRVLLSLSDWCLAGMTE